MGRIWSKDSGVCHLIIDAGHFIIYIAQLRDDRICSGDNRGNVRIWNIFTGVCELTLNGHNSAIRAIVVIDELRICSGSADKTIKIWNVSSGVCQRTLEGHTDYVTDMVLLLDGRLCSVSSDGNVKIWTIETGVCDLTVYTSKATSYKVFQFDDGRIIVSDKHSCLVYIIGG
jgi:WD40 repeat protein